MPRYIIHMSFFGKFFNVLTQDDEEDDRFLVRSGACEYDARGVVSLAGSVLFKDAPAISWAIPRHILNSEPLGRDTLLNEQFTSFITYTSLAHANFASWGVNDPFGVPFPESVLREAFQDYFKFGVLDAAGNPVRVGDSVRLSEEGRSGYFRAGDVVRIVDAAIVPMSRLRGSDAAAAERYYAYARKSAVDTLLQFLENEHRASLHLLDDQPLPADVVHAIAEARHIQELQYKPTLYDYMRQSAWDNVFNVVCVQRPAGAADSTTARRYWLRSDGVEHSETYKSEEDEDEYEDEDVYFDE